MTISCEEANCPLWVQEDGGHSCQTINCNALLERIVVLWLHILKNVKTLIYKIPCSPLQDKLDFPGSDFSLAGNQGTEMKVLCKITISFLLNNMQWSPIEERKTYVFSMKSVWFFDRSNRSYQAVLWFVLSYCLLWSTNWFKISSLQAGLIWDPGRVGLGTFLRAGGVHVFILRAK